MLIVMIGVGISSMFWPQGRPKKVSSKPWKL
jgi:hypothetical protein